LAIAPEPICWECATQSAGDARPDLLEMPDPNTALNAEQMANTHGIRGIASQRLLRVLVAAIAIASGATPAIAHAPILAAAGDIACAPGGKTTATECQQAATARLIKRAHPAAVAALGDNQYENGGLAEYFGTGAFDATWGAFKPLIHPVPGNEDYATANASGYFQYFGGAADPAGASYYSYELGAWHVIALNSNCSDLGCVNSLHGQMTSAELRWLASDLAGARQRCILAYWHHPLFTSTLMLGGERALLPLWRMLFSARVDVVLNGHAHDYERFARRSLAGATPAGIREFVLGTGGRSLFNFKMHISSTSQRRDRRDFGALFLILHRDSYDWAFRTIRGVERDRGSDRCHHKL